MRLLLTSLIAALLTSCPLVASADRVDTLLEGVSAIGFPGSPGPISVFGPNAFPVVTTKAGNQESEQAPIIAAASFGKGRMVALGHNGYFSDALDVADTGRLILNLVAWAGRMKTSPQTVRIAIRDYPGLADLLQQQGLKVEALQDRTDLKEVDVVILNTHRMSTDRVTELQDYVHQGGGLIASGLGWAWLGYAAKPGQTLAESPGNQLFAPAGITWCDGHLKPVPNRRLKVAKPSGHIHAHKAFQALRSATENQQSLRPKEWASIAFSLRLALQQLPESDELLRPQLLSFIQERTDVLPIPSPERPIRKIDHRERTWLTLHTLALEHLPANKIEAHPAARLFPGDVSKDTPRLEKNVIIDTSVPDWHSTGLYAAPGEMISVKVPKDAVGRLSIRIGCHRDRLWHKDRWRRVPEITIEEVVKERMIRLTNAFGGLVYVVVPDQCDLGSVPVKVDGCVRAPFFQLGKTDVSKWRSEICNRQAPWAELATEKIILTVPSKDIRQLDHPDELMAWWNRVLDAQADLRTIPRKRIRPERLVMDQQISAGYLHAGYPIMGQFHHGAEAVDLATLSSQGNWGFYHELGHNHQHRDWTFKGTGEVTVNLFSLYCLDKLNPGAKVHPSVREAAIDRHIAQFRVTGDKSNAFCHLVPYIQMQREFGWETYKEVFAEYEQLAANERPRTDQQKQDQWLVRFSRHAGRNLGPFFEFWKIETTEAARQSLSNLPIWMPEELNPQE